MKEQKCFRTNAITFFFYSKSTKAFMSIIYCEKDSSVFQKV